MVLKSKFSSAILILLSFSIYSQLKSQCNPPTSIWLNSAQTSNSMEFNWPLASNAIGYELLYWDIYNTADKTIVEGISAPPKTISGLNQSTTYSVQVRSKCTGNVYSTWSTAATNGTSSNNAVCDIPTGMSATGSTTSISVSYTSTGSHTVRYRMVGTSDWKIPSNGLSVTTSPISITGLPAGTYQVELKRNCSITSSPYVQKTVYVGTAPCGIPAAPIVSPGSTNAIINLPSGFGINSYNIQYHLGTSGTFTTVPSNQTPVPYTLASLSASSTYQVKIRANCTGASSAYSALTTFTTCSNGADVSTGVVGDPNTINVPQDKTSVYSGRTQNTFKDMLGVNVKKGDEQSFQNSMADLTSVFSHARVFQHMNKDYWSNRPDNNAPHPSVLPFAQRGNLKLITNSDGKPQVSNTYNSTDKMTYYDVTTQSLKTTNSAEAVQPLWDPNGQNPHYFNLYQNYMNQNFFFIKDVYNKFSKKVQVTLVIVKDVLPPPYNGSANTTYDFPKAEWQPNDWGTTSANRKIAARAYAMMFARTYSPKASDCPSCTSYVDILEVGNEWWGYTDSTVYYDVLSGLVEGIDAYYGTETANKIKVMGGAFQANHKENTTPPDFNYLNWKDYQGTRIPASKKCHIWGSNYHPYSNDLGDNTANWFKQRLIAHPEKSNSKFRYIKNGWKWNQTNLPSGNRNMAVTEYGWDSEFPQYCGGNPLSTNWNIIGVGRVAQSVYLTRSTLMLARYGVTRAQPYELLDEDVDPVNAATLCFAYHSSGVYDKGTTATEKPSQFSLKKMINLIGNKKFNYAIQENNEGIYAYVLEENSTPTHIVIWRAINSNGTDNSNILNDWTTLKGQTTNWETINLNTGAILSVNTSGNFYYLDDKISGNSPTAMSQTEKNSVFNGSQFKACPVPILIPVNVVGFRSDINAGSRSTTTIDEEDITISPNPTSDDLIVSFNKDVYIDVKFTVFDALGNLVLPNSIQKISNSSYTLNVMNMKSGLYLLDIEFNNQKLVKKFIKVN